MNKAIIENRLYIKPLDFSLDIFILPIEKKDKAFIWVVTCNTSIMGLYYETTYVLRFLG